MYMYVGTDSKGLHGCRRLWQYAIHAVLQDLGKHWPPQRLSGKSLLEWRRQRQLYTDLWRRQLQQQRQKSAPNQVFKACPLYPSYVCICKMCIHWTIYMEHIYLMHTCVRLVSLSARQSCTRLRKSSFAAAAVLLLNLLLHHFESHIVCC